MTRSSHFLFLSRRPGPDTETELGLKKGHKSPPHEAQARPPEADGWTAYSMSLEWLRGYCQQKNNPESSAALLKFTLTLGSRTKWRSLNQ